MMTASFRHSAARLILNYINTGEELRRDADSDSTEFFSTLEDAGIGGDVALSDTFGGIRYLPEEERLELLSDMWTLAANDDDIVEDADLFILSAAEALDLPISTVEIVRPARFAELAHDAEKTAVNG